MVDVVGDIGGVQAQLSNAAELALWARVDDLTPESVQAAISEQRTLVKSWFMRGTLHLLRSTDLPAWIGASRLRNHFRKSYWLKNFGVTADEMDAILATVPAALDGGKTLTREELAEAVGAVAGTHLRDGLLSGWGKLLQPAAFQGLLIFGPPRGQQVTFARPDQWLGSTEPWAPEVAQSEVARRFFHAYGPATADDFGRWWGGLQPAELKRWLRLVMDELEEVEVVGQERKAWVLKSDAAALANMAAPSGLRLLPHFDVYVLHAMPRDALVAEPHMSRVFRPQGWISPVVLVHGVARGVWEHERKADRVDLRVTCFEPLSSVERRALDDEVGRLNAFLARPVNVTFAD
jgi:hypothetical protein